MIQWTIKKNQAFRQDNTIHSCIYSFTTGLCCCMSCKLPRLLCTFSANVPFLKPLKTLENQWFSDIFRKWAFLMFSGEIKRRIWWKFSAIQMEFIFTENTKLLKLTQLCMFFNYFRKIFHAIEVLSLKKYTKLSAIV